MDRSLGAQGAKPHYDSNLVSVSVALALALALVVVGCWR